MMLAQALAPDIKNPATRCAEFTKHYDANVSGYITFAMFKGCYYHTAQEVVNDAFIKTYPHWMEGVPRLEDELPPYLREAISNGVKERHRHNNRHKRRANLLADSIDNADSGAAYALERSRHSEHDPQEVREELEDRIKLALEYLPIIKHAKTVLDILKSGEVNFSKACKQHGIERSAFNRAKTAIIKHVKSWLKNHP